MTRARMRFWLSGLLVGLFALAIVPAPAQHGRAMLERASFVLAHALPDGSLPDLCADDPADPHGRHLFGPACLACVLMAAPGLAVPPLAQPTRRATAVAANRPAPVAVAFRPARWTPLRPRAPPAPATA
jgi:hypothetical protein